MGEAKWAANGQYGVAKLKRIFVGESCWIQILPVDLHHPDVSTDVGPQSQGLYFPPVVETNGDVVEFSPIDHVAVGDDYRAASHAGNHTGARFIFACLAILWSQGRLFCVDVDNRRADELREFP